MPLADIIYAVVFSRVLCTFNAALADCGLQSFYKDSDGVAFKKEWNQKFAWFTQSKECEKITTIHGAKNSMTHTCSGFSRHPH